MRTFWTYKIFTEEEGREYDSDDLFVEKTDAQEDARIMLGDMLDDYDLEVEWEGLWLESEMVVNIPDVASVTLRRMILK